MDAKAPKAICVGALEFGGPTTMSWARRDGRRVLSLVFSIAQLVNLGAAPSRDDFRLLAHLFMLSADVASENDDAGA